MTKSRANATAEAAKGDLRAGSGTNTTTILPVGADGTTLVANSANSSGLGWNQNFAAGKNKILNSDYSIWQRGTSFTVTGQFAYTADRWQSITDGTTTVSQQAFTAGSAPVAGYESQYFLRYAHTATPTAGSYWTLQNKIEDVRTYAGQTVNLSFWAKVASGVTQSVSLVQSFGTGGSSDVTTFLTSPTLTTSWARYSMSVTLPSITGKTIGAGSYLAVSFTGGSTAITLDLWGVQLEAGSVATAFQTATGTIQQELAACQRYYFRSVSTSSYGWFGSGMAANGSSTSIGIPAPVTMRVVPTSVDFSTLCLVDAVTATAVTSCTIDSNVSSNSFGVVTAGVASGLTQYRPYYLRQNANNAGYIGFSAEL